MSKHQNLDLVPTVALPPDRPDLSRPSLAGLAWLLRNQPEGPFPLQQPNQTHAWDFRFSLEPAPCGSVGCAMGVANLQWGASDRLPVGMSRLCAAEHLSCADIERLFIAGHRSADYDRITPAVVANRIDKFLAERKQS